MAQFLTDGFSSRICFSCAVPSSSVLGTAPTGLTTGYMTGIFNSNGGVINNLGGIVLDEISVTPPGLDGTGAIDITTMRNVKLRTMAPKRLKTVTAMTATVAYDPVIHPILNYYLLINQLIYVAWPDGSLLAFWGFVDKFAPGDMSEGVRPTATITIEPTNRNNACPALEILPLYTDGTACVVTSCSAQYSPPACTGV